MKHLSRGILSVVLLFSVAGAFAQQAESTPQFRREFLEEINRVRQKGCNCGSTYMPPAPPLVWNDQLEIAAIGHVRDMAAQNYFSHTSLDGRTMQARAAAVGYTYTGFKSYMIGENIAQGQMSISEVMQGWFKSVGHCKNLMNPGFKEVGVAVANNYWVQDFGGREAFPEDVQKMIKSGKYHLIEKQ
jgi:uncharacterized protein YkwD